mgnify:CR=1 FL=1|tara:strand:+ start:3832 stop:4131 length:300 start_codon:yes stop_codon:yes gene_type:complete
MNRSKKILDKDVIYKMACIQCTSEEIAEVVGCSPAHLNKHFKNLMIKGRENGKKSLRRAMWDKALQGDTRAQIFLSKQTLGFKDNPEDHTNNTPLPWED